MFVLCFYVCFVFCVFCVFCIFCVGLLFLLLSIAVSFLFLYKSTDHYHRVETQLQ
jgi:CHASE3 domain sensor protein